VGADREEELGGGVEVGEDGERAVVGRSDRCDESFGEVELDKEGTG